MKVSTLYGIMILVFKRYGNHPARIIPNVVDICTDGDDTFVWKVGKHTNSFHKGIPVETMESRYQVAYVMCGEDDCARLGVGDSLIKWLVWGNVWIADYLQHEAQRYIKKNPI